ncbi:MAG: 1,4-alpha-glucan-branching enzyme, partial [Muribaculaceae bacterium]|nr:1,4-alpha-glucan-branching enzyme [Muribaculaceae bacterium]
MKRKPKLAIIKNDPWLAPYAAAIEGRHEDALKKEAKLTAEAGSLSEMANAHQYFGLHRTADGWVFREWAPNATEIPLTGDFSKWQEMSKY